MLNIEKQIKKVNLIEFSQIYPNANGNIENMLKDIPRQNLLDNLIYLSNSSLETNKRENYDITLKKYFKNSNSECYTLIYRYLEQIEVKINRSIDLFNSYTCLKVLEYVCSNLEKFPVSSTTDIEAQKLNILYAVFIQNEDYNKIVKKNATLLSNPPKFDELVKYVISTNFAVHDVINFSPVEFFFQNIKGWLLFKFLFDDKRFQFHLKKIMEYYNCNDIEDLFFKTMNVLDTASLVDFSNNYTINTESENKWLKIFIEKFIKIAEYDNSSIDFFQLKNYPILKISENLYQITYLKFFLDKFYRSWYFQLKEIDDNADEEHKFKDIRATYCKDFTESILCVYFLERTFSKKVLKMTDSQILEKIKSSGLVKKGITKSVPDFYIREGDSIFLFEIKDSLFSGKIKSSMDFNDIEKSLSDKFNHKTVSGKELRGVPQLIGYISDIVKSEHSYDGSTITDDTKFYSILLLADDVYNSLGINYLINTWFDEELKNSDIPPSKYKLIHQLCVINIDTLILLVNPIASGKISLQLLIDMYVEECLSSEKSIRNLDKLVIPFSAYVYNYLLVSDIPMEENITSTFGKFLDGTL